MARQGYLLLASTVLLATHLVPLHGCVPFPSSRILGPTQADWESLLREHGVDPQAFPHPLAATDEMRETARRLAGLGQPRQRLERLQQALFNRSQFPFRYETEGTLTATEAFARREGNCLSFTNLFISLARTLDIQVRAAFPIYHYRSDRQDDLIVVNTHVVAALRDGHGIEVYDFDRTRQGPPRPVVIIDDTMHAALYLNNRGVEELRAGSEGEAARHLEAAVALAPDFAGAWGNLGVVRRRSGDHRGAIEAYGRALEIEPQNPTLLTNLAALYRTMGRETEARTALAAADFSLASPHVLLVRGDLEKAEGRVKEALDHYRRAHRLDRRHPDPLLAIARAEWEQGRKKSALRTLDRALDRDPENQEGLNLRREWEVELQGPGAAAGDTSD